MTRIHAGLASLALVLLSGCQKQAAEAPAPKPAASVPAGPPAVAQAPMPDAGKVDSVLTQATGYGASPAAATSDALKAAVLQVNGATIDSGSVQLKYGLDVTDGRDTLSLSGSAFAEMVAQRSGGAITRFRMVELAEPKVKGGQFKSVVEAHIAHFTAPVADARKLKVVVAPIRFGPQRFVVGTESMPAQRVADDIRQQVASALTNTGRFSVLERELGPDIENELAMIADGAAPRAEQGKLGQAVTADVIWVGTINSLGYQRHARQLRSSDRELVSYSGGWAVSQKLVNVATRQVMSSDALEGRAPDVAATTLGSGVDGGRVMQGMVSDIVNRIVASIVTRSFPITVVSMDAANVVLSQGGQTVRPGARYAVVTMGREMRDPQTGQSLGRVESPCCEIVVDKVTASLSYGHLENLAGPLIGVAAGELQLREQLPNRAATAGPERPRLATPAGRKGRREPAVDGPPHDPKEDGKW